MDELHADYLKAPEEQQWRGDLLALWAFFEREAPKASPAWVGVVLPGGAHVGVRVLEGGLRELVIYRTEPYRTENGDALWAAEVMTFRRHFKALDWEKEHDFRKNGGPMITLRERVRSQDLFEGP